MTEITTLVKVAKETKILDDVTPEKNTNFWSYKLLNMSRVNRHSLCILAYLFFFKEIEL